MRRPYLFARRMASATTLVASLGFAVLGPEAPPSVAASTSVGAPASVAAPASRGHEVLVAGSHRYDLELATTGAQQALGLGGRASMPAASGMLFVWHGAGDRCFWMKGMRFSLDMVWLSPSGRVVYLQQDISPKSSQVFCAKAEDVVELDAGQVAAAGILPGEVLKLEVPPR